MGEPKMNLPLLVLTVKILRLQGGNSIILNLGSKTKILSYVSCFYQKSLAKKKKKKALPEKVPPDYFALYVSYCFFPFQSFPQTRALLIFRQRSTCITELPKGSTLGVFTSSTHYHQEAIFPLKLRRWNLTMMYRSNRSFNMPPTPGIPRAFDTFAVPGRREFDYLSLPGGGEFDPNALGVGNLNCTFDFM